MMDRKKYLAILSVVVISSLYLNVCKAEVGWIEGTVTAADSDRPMETARIFAKNVSKVVHGFSNYSGSYRLEVPAGTYNVTAQYFCYTDQRVSVSVSAGETITQDFALAPSEGPCGVGPGGGIASFIALLLMALIGGFVIVILAIVYKLGNRKKEKTEQTALAPSNQLIPKGKFCPECRKLISVESKFCSNCGKELKTD